jgi:radical SAM family uncharacterized protein/radical SAM-linked protein
MSDAVLRRSLFRVEKPARYVGGEWNEVRKNPRTASLKVALAFPDVYEIGMSYLGQKILYGLLNHDPSVLAERVFAPWPDFEQELRRSGRPLASLENEIPLGEFDIVGFSLLYELNYSNVLTMLDLGGIPFRSVERNERHPLIIAGGPAAFNPEPVAEIFDLFFLGDGEEGFPEILAALRRLRGGGLDRASVLKALSAIEGVYVPSLYAARKQEGSPLLVPKPLGDAPARIPKRVLRTFGRSYFPQRIVVPSLRVVFDRVAMEAARGCPQNCRFCQAASVYFPHRTKDPDFALRTLIGSLRQTGYEDGSLSALSISDYPHLEETVRGFMDEVAREKISLSLSSLRPRGLSAEIVENLLKVRKTGLTLVPEAGTERLRAVINKKLTDAEIAEALTAAFSGGWQLVKFYFMVGLPTETEEDVRAIVALIRRSLESGRSILGRPPRIHVSLSSFIPKPHTPFQWAGMDSEASLAEKQRLVRSELGRAKSVEFKDHPVRTSVLEAAFSRGDRRLNGVLIRAWSKGARFDSWADRLCSGVWTQAFAEEGVDIRDYLGPIDERTDLPWGHIETGLNRSHLRREYALALRGEWSPGCLERSCAECGGCKLRFWKKPPAAFRKPRLPAAQPPLGEATDQLFRYRLIYAKRGKARFLSHIDLIHVLQRAFRRAGVEVRKTQGFHPKMDLSYGPALPLGIEGLREVLEFKSSYRLDGRRLVARLNRSFPAGVRAVRLDHVGTGEPSLSKAIDGLVYSFDWTSEDCVEAWRTAHPAGEDRPPVPDPAALRKRLADYRSRRPDAAGIRATVRGKKVRLVLPAFPQKGLRPQDIAAEAFGITEPAFLLRREAVILRPGCRRIDRAVRIP